MHALYPNQVEGELYFLAAGFRRGAFCARPSRGRNCVFWLPVSEGVPFVADPVGAATVGDGLADRRIAGSPGRAASLSRGLDSPMRAPRKAPRVVMKRASLLPGRGVDIVCFGRGSAARRHRCAPTTHPVQECRVPGARRIAKHMKPRAACKGDPHSAAAKISRLILQKKSFSCTSNRCTI